MKGIYTHAQKYVYLTHHDEGTFPFTLMWHAIFGHANYDKFHLMKNNYVSDLSTIPMKQKQCIACRLGMHTNIHFITLLQNHV